MPGIDECLLEAMALPGARGAAVIDWVSGLSLGVIGHCPNGDHEASAAESAELARMAAESTIYALEDAAGAGSGSRSGDPAAAGTGTGAASGAGSGAGTGGAAKGLPVEDIIVTTRDGYHLSCFVQTTFDSSVFLALWLDRAEGNLALARIRLRQLAERLVLS
ncbi:hypothetical protein LRS74_29535 [Streptomyces sp. LX-29]|uniref:hypothetical protein n=1 Tax=Streptomyces sp. LX-29 TaxID=2900152 RepID=UPI00240D9CDF|nr:hypothetical protein [Streptomyces sp. LX-29]WFB10717.1 hypothetical protein LRS74_29535 [Streptomyces sp. LX-29]